ncbi:MAG TPA: L-lactate permease [Bacillales bacterium]|nr:L-lactate permease [Bacillales bacterium]
MLALLPLIAIFVFLFLLKQSPVRTGIFTYCLAIGIVVFSSAYALPVTGIMHATVKGALFTLIVAYVVFFGVLLFEIMERSGNLRKLAEILTASSQSKMTQMIILVTGISPLIESTSGFGTAFLVVAPILSALGFSKSKAAMLGLVSLMAVPWGALATGTFIGAKLGHLPLERLGVGSALLSLPVFVYFLTVAVWIAGGRQAVNQHWQKIALFSVIFGGSIVFFNRYVSVELAGALSALITTCLGLFFLKANRSLLQVMSPYFFLTGTIVCTRLFDPIKKFLQSYAAIHLPNYDFAFAPLYAPGFWLFLTCAGSIVFFKLNRKDMRAAVIASFQKWRPFTIATIAFVSMAEVMTAAGMTRSIAEATATLFGPAYLLVAPFVAGLGGFLTASNTSANAIFMPFQVQTAKHVHIPPELLASVQNTGASHATMSSPSRILLAQSVCGLESSSNHLLLRMIGITAGALILIAASAACWFWVL